MNKLYILFAVLLHITPLCAQNFPGPVGQQGSTAIKRDSTIFKAWATEIVVERGYLNKADTNYFLDGTNRASFGQDSFALGPASVGTYDVVSLGDGGVATLKFGVAISNGPGFDFAVFENSFTDSFLELAFVEVSSDGEHFYRFPSISNTSVVSQIGSFSSIDARNIHNLAGKYRGGYGTPFDLEELDDAEFLDKNYIVYVRIVDVVGSILESIATVDSEGHIVNDPFPTPFETGGFDLDAIGVINYTTLGIQDHLSKTTLEVFPNPFSDYFSMYASEEMQISVCGLEGQVIDRFNLSKEERLEMDFSSYRSGVYVITTSTGANIKLIKQ